MAISMERVSNDSCDATYDEQGADEMWYRQVVAGEWVI